LSKISDIIPINCSLYFLPVETRVPLKFGTETLMSVTCARVKMSAQKTDGQVVDGWGETPLSVQWVWPSQVPYSERHAALKDFCLKLVDAWGAFESSGHAMEVGHDFQKKVLPALLAEFNQERGNAESMPWLAALVCCSAFDIALHDAYGVANRIPVYQTYAPPYMEADLSHYLEPAQGADVDFKGKYPVDFFVAKPPSRIPAWHLVGGLDPILEDELSGDEPDDGYPVLLGDWIERDGLNCLKVKLRGTDYEWDYQRLVQVGKVAIEHGVDWLTTDFNSTVLDPAYVNAMLDQLVIEHPRIYGMILYVEQPFPYELEKHQIDVHSVSARKPLFMDESAHDWELVRLGRSLGWTGVALKTCKTQTGALLSLCWAKAHGMTLMVQDLTNPMLAQIPHVLLAAHAGTIMGVETNAMQFYPEASNAEVVVHPGLYRRSEGHLDLASISGPGFGYRLDEVKRDIPEPATNQ
jgi:L-alanine-DL-glutamate epimerase-like enolase superfamily enzyme